MAVYDLSARTDEPPVLRTNDRTFLRAGTLVGDGPSVMYVDENLSLVLATKGSDTLLAKLDGFPQLAASPDRRRVAIAINTAMQIWDDHGKRVAQFTAGGRIVAMAWSPDLRTLAVSTDAGIELWTVPR
jgi:hypothetical protein